MVNKLITSEDWPLGSLTEPSGRGSFNVGIDEDMRRQADASREKNVARFRLLWSRRPFLFRCTVLGLAISLLIAFFIPSRFTSTTRLMPPDQTSSSMALLASAASNKAGAGVGAFAGDLLGLKSSGALFVGILQGRTVQDDLINAFDLRRVYALKRWGDARASLAKNTRIIEDSKSGIITIEVTDRSPQRAAALAQEYVRELDRVMTSVNTTAAHRERVFLEDRLAHVQSDLETAEKGFSQFASENSAIDIQAQGKALIEAGAALEGELIAAQTELQGLKQVYAAENVHVRATQARVQELERQLAKVGGSPAAATANPQDAAAAYPSLRQLPLLGVSYSDLYRATKVQEAVYETLTQQYELAKVEEAKETPSVKVIDLPDVPENKSSPHRLSIALAGASACFLFSAAWILGADHWRHIDPQDPARILALEMFGSLKSYWPFYKSNGLSRG